MIIKDAFKPTFGIYFHWPFCEARCPYCDFNTYAEVGYDQETWKSAYLRQLDTYAATTERQPCDTVFFGGGTPSLLQPRIIAAILDRIDQLWRLASDAEITLEANPSSTESAKFARYSNAGINRISIGVQSLNDTDLKRLGRMHSVTEAKTAFEIAANQFSQVSVDLMFGRQFQRLANWQQELDDIMQWGAQHLSLYQLTIEPKTVFGLRHQAGRLEGLPNDALAAEMQLAAAAICHQYGYYQYEISNYAQLGYESRHNLIYWRCHDFLGIGPGAHGRLTIDGQRISTETYLLPNKWLEAVSTTGCGEVRRTKLTKQEIATEYLMMSLRLTEGTNLSRLQKYCKEILNNNALNQLLEHKFVEIKDNHLKVTNSGRLVLNSIISTLMPIE